MTIYNDVYISPSSVQHPCSQIRYLGRPTPFTEISFYVNFGVQIPPHMYGATYTPEEDMDTIDIRNMLDEIELQLEEMQKELAEFHECRAGLEI